MIEPETLKTETDWVDAGRRIFEQADHLDLRTWIRRSSTRPEEVNRFSGSGRNCKEFALGADKGRRRPFVSKLFELSFPGIAEWNSYSRRSDVCHCPAGDRTAGTDADHAGSVREALCHRWCAVPNGFSSLSASGAIPRFGVPWKTDDINAQLKTATQAEYDELVAAGLRGALPRWNGSLYYPAKVPDLIGIKDRKYIDATGTHLNRGIGDLMRYAALVSFADSSRFGPHDMLADDSKRPEVRRSDEALYALALYIQSLKAPQNPNPIDERSMTGEKIFKREGCVGCHVPPLYTSNKLTLARGFAPPKDKPSSLDVVPISVGTDPGLALSTRKGTGHYKVPSLKGVWYRGHYLHDGSVASLEEMFDPERLKETHVPGGWSPPGVKSRAIKGHEFGLALQPAEREQLIAFLRTL